VKVEPSRWDIVGGHVQAGETPSAILTETEEEIGVKLRKEDITELEIDTTLKDTRRSIFGRDHEQNFVHTFMAVLTPQQQREARSFAVNRAEVTQVVFKPIWLERKKAERLKEKIKHIDPEVRSHRNDRNDEYAAGFLFEFMDEARWPVLEAALKAHGVPIEPWLVSVAGPGRFKAIAEGLCYWYLHLRYDRVEPMFRAIRSYPRLTALLISFVVVCFVCFLKI
jgi:8-oxo-dGTP pyrophosphatase MutT (NUDIX family)